MTNDNGRENMNFRSIRKKKACAKNQPVCIFCAVLCCLAKGVFRSLETKVINIGFFALNLTARVVRAGRTVLFFFVELHLEFFLFTGSISTVSSLLFEDCQIQGKFKDSNI